MNGLQKARKFGYLVIGGLFSLGIVIATQVSLANRAYAEEGHESGGPMAHCGGPGPKRGFEKGWARHHRMHARLWEAFKQADLSATQKSAIHEIFIAMKKDMIQKRADLKIAKIELREQLRKDNVDMMAVESQLKKIEGLKVAMKLNMIKARQEIKSQLTPDQQKKIKEFMLKSHADFDHMKHSE